ncbi:MAG: hypothetical protein EBX52_05970 [Proteobacteria bacterium]|nr:hypothetical protein [Pseudomonadota bacterium]
MEGSRVNLMSRVSGGSGSEELRLTWRFGPAYRQYGVETQFEHKAKAGKLFSLMIPELRDDVPYAQQTVLLTARDRETGEASSAEVLFTVSRKVILMPSADPAFLDRNCYQRFPATESMVGVLTNGSTNLSSLVIKQGVERLWSNSVGTSWGFYISPLSWIPGIASSLANLFMANRSYYSNVSKQVSETVEVSSEYQLSPGDTIQIYSQKTRFITFYDAQMVGACGKRTLLKGAYPLQWWGFAYHAVPLNPYDPTRPGPATIGAPPVNTCPAGLTPGSGDASYSFFQTNL